MSGGSFNYLCDREAYELPARTRELQDMVLGLRARGYEPEARETEQLIEQINLFQQTMEARAKDLRAVWKAVEWEASGDWSKTAIDEEIVNHRRHHPQGTRAPGLPEREWETGATPEQRAAHDGPRFGLRYGTAEPPRPEPTPYEDGPEGFADEWNPDVLRWLHWATGRALTIAENREAEARHQAAEDARWDGRRTELIAQFNGGPVDPSGGYPIPTMGLRAVEYIIATEREARHQGAVGHGWAEAAHILEHQKPGLRKTGNK